jgi:hypothetical protein
MREIRQSGSEGGGDETNRLSLPLSLKANFPEGLSYLDSEVLIIDIGFLGTLV